MKVKVMKDQKLSHAQACDLARLAAIKALNTLEKEGTYTEENSDRLWDTAWTAADYSIVCEDASIEEAAWLAEEAARRHAKALIGGNLRLKYIQEGRITPAWRVQLAELQQQKLAQ